jgi:dTDP-4-dehydrorhamnose 3,5-epimerase
MRFEPTSLPGVVVVELKVFGDERGFFCETYQSQRFAAAGIHLPFVQDNHSRSQAGVLRGLHFQVQQAQGKLIQVLRGEIFDVAVDLRRSSPTFGCWFGLRLGEDSRRLLYIPPGCAHGFCVVSGPADVCYKCTDFYAPQHERTLLWSDPEIGIEWPITGEPLVSAKDQQGLPLVRCETFE